MLCTSALLSLLFFTFVNSECEDVCARAFAHLAWLHHSRIHFHRSLEAHMSLVLLFGLSATDFARTLPPFFPLCCRTPHATLTPYHVFKSSTLRLRSEPVTHFKYSNLQ
jgi:hypothetical protein